MESRIRPSSQVYLIGIVLLALALRLWGSGQSLWLDEAAQHTLSMNPFQSGHFRGDFQPPLFYYLTWVWQHIASRVYTMPYPEWFLRIPSILIGVITVIVTYALGRQVSHEHVHARQAGLLAGLLIALSPLHVYYSHEIRMYGLLTLLVASSWLALFRQKWKWLAILTSFGIFTHYFMFVHIASQLAYVVLQRVFNRSFLPLRISIRSAVVALGLGLVPFVVWLPTFMQQISTSQSLIQAWPGWSAVSNTGFLRFPALFIAKMTVGMISPEPRWLYAGSVGIALLVLGVSFLYNRRTSWFAVLPLLMGWIGGMFVPATSPTRMQFVLPMMLVWLATTYYKAQSSSRTYVRIGAHMCLALVVAQSLAWTSTYLLQEKYQRENWKEAVSFTDKQVRDGGVVLSEYVAPWASLVWYSRNLQAYHGATSELHITAESVDVALKKIGVTGDSPQKPRTIVVYTYLFELSDPAKVVEQAIMKHGYELESQKDFRGVGIVNTYTDKRAK